MSVRNFANNAAQGTNSKGLPPVYPEPKVGSVLKTKLFQDACKAAEVEPTNRQASKFVNKQGSAYAAFRIFGEQELSEMASQN